jgi:methylmalonyl-CoA/ethylmalonyl-CoA epimerase
VTSAPAPDPAADGALLSGLDAVFDHAAHAAHRIRDLLLLYRDLLGGRFLNGGDNPRTGYRVVQLGFRDGTKVELMEPRSGSSFLESFLASRPHGGLHHLTFKVTDIHAALHRIEELGLTATGVNFDNPNWRELFVHPRQGFGALLQLAQQGPEPWGRPGLTLDDVLAGRGPNGDGRPSP